MACSLASTVRAQDMPLSQILIDGEGWREGGGKPPEPTIVLTSVRVEKGDPNAGIVNQIYIQYTINDKNFTQIIDQVSDKPHTFTAPTAGFVSRDGGTVYLSNEPGYIWAYPAKADGTLLPGQPYCQVRLSQKERKSVQTKLSTVTAMTGDKDGRIYAATPLGVQVFDPTGRLCGVLTPAAPGKVENMAIEGDKLTLWIDDVRYQRKLNTTGIKAAKRID